MNGTSKSEKQLRLACEISASHVVAVRATEKGSEIETCAVRSLSPGSVKPALTETNVTNRDSLAGALSDALTSVGTSHRDVIAVIPDAACRVVILDFDTLPTKQQEAESVVRFRLKKSLPFEVEHARISYDVSPTNGMLRVIAAVALPDVIEEYESAFRAVGFSPGYVIPSTLAALGMVDSADPSLIVKIAADITSVSVVSNDDLILYRTLENVGDGLIDPEQLAEEIYPSVVFFQDTYGVPIKRILMDGVTSFERFFVALEAGTGVRVQELVPQTALSSSAIGSAHRPFVAGPMGALIS